MVCMVHIAKQTDAHFMIISANAKIFKLENKNVGTCKFENLQKNKS